MSAASNADAALGPVGAQMLRAAADQADALRAGARQEAATILARAQDSAAEMVAHAEAAGRRDAAAIAAAERARGRGESRTVVLSAQRAASDALRARVREEVTALRNDPGYSRLLDRITTMARLSAGPEAALSTSPDGGVLARSPGLVVDCSLTWLADLAVLALGPSVQDLWTP